METPNPILMVTLGTLIGLSIGRLTDYLIKRRLHHGQPKEDGTGKSDQPSDQD